MRLDERMRALRDHMERVNSETWPVLIALTAEDMQVEVYSGEEGLWTVKDVLGHLADAERGQLGQAQRLVAGERTVPPDFDIDRWNRRAVRRAGPGSPQELLDEISDAFREALTFLDGLSEDDLDKTGLHSSLRTFTTEGFLRRIVDHREEHTSDIQAALG